MKNSLLTVIIVLIGNIVMAGNPNNGGISARTSKVDSKDTVVFDLSKAIINSDDVQFPVSILSDDTINSLDFSFKFNHANLIYDSIINLTLHLQPVSNYNTSDSTVRFSSYNNDRYKNDTPIVNIRFTTIYKPISSSDLNTIKAYLNGDACSVKVINALTTGTWNMQELNNIKVYPNPAIDLLNVEAPEKAAVQLSDINGKVILQANVNANERQDINTQNFARGIYLLKVYNDAFLSVKKVVINK